MAVSYRTVCGCLLTGLTLMISACGEEMPDGPRVLVVPVKGQILVDGEPADHLQVKCLPVGMKKDDEKLDGLPTSSDYTDKEGKFEIGTFEAGDGAPPGEYNLTFMWGQYNLMNGRYEGPDKLKDRYTDPETSEHQVMVVEGTPMDMGTIELTTKE